MSEPAIVFDGVTKSYPSFKYVKGGMKHFLFNINKGVRDLRGHREVLKDVSFAVGQGESFGIIGRNGMGKSTTLGLMAKVLRPTKGMVVVRDRVSPLLELGAGFHSELTGMDNILLNGVLMGLRRKEVRQRIPQIVEFSELGELVHHPLRTYSSGMVARLGFSIIAHTDPRVMLIDEVLAVGDITFQHKCLEKMSEFSRDDRVTIVLVSHDLKSVREVCHRVAWLDNGRIRMIGKTEEVVEAFERAYASGQGNSEMLSRR